MDALGWRIYLRFVKRRVQCMRCGGIKVEHLDWLAENTRYTARMAEYVGRLCRRMTNKGVAEVLHLHEHTVKELDKLYLVKLLGKHPVVAPRVVGIDELAIGRGHTYRVIVSDIERGRVIWIGGKGRRESDLDQCFRALGERKTKRIELAVMDMWQPFRHSLERHAPQAAILYDKFHILQHLSKAMDGVRRAEYKRATEEERAFIKGQRYVLLSHRENLKREAKQSLKKLLAVNKRLSTAYLLKEEFAQLWDYSSEFWARRFFEKWKQKLRWQRLKPFEKFARMVEAHWDGIAPYFLAENQVKLGFVEGVNNKVRVMQRQAYGYRDEEYMKLKIMASFLP